MERNALPSGNLCGPETIGGGTLFFFFKQKTAYEITRCWSSDVCSSDLTSVPTIYIKASLSSDIRLGVRLRDEEGRYWLAKSEPQGVRSDVRPFLIELPPEIKLVTPRSEERRVGKECRSRWSPYH